MTEDTTIPARSERAPGRNFDYFEVPNPTHTYVDGVNGFTLGTTVTRIEFFRVKKVKDGGGLDGQPLEVREQHLTLVLPTPAFVEFLGNSLKGLKDNQEALSLATGEQAQGFINFLKGIVGSDGGER